MLYLEILHLLGVLVSKPWRNANAQKPSALFNLADVCELDAVHSLPVISINEQHSLVERIALIQTSHELHECFIDERSLQRVVMCVVIQAVTEREVAFVRVSLHELLSQAQTLPMVRDSCTTVLPFARHLLSPMVQMAGSVVEVSWWLTEASHTLPWVEHDAQMELVGIVIHECRAASS